MRRTLWRFGDNQKEPEIFGTTGDRPAGCLAIAAAPETAEIGVGRSSLVSEEHDICAHDKENAKFISQNMESIIENGGFRFKGTVLTGYPLDKTK